MDEKNIDDNSDYISNDYLEKNDFQNYNNIYNINNVNNTIEEKYMKTGSNFNKNIILENIRNVERENNTNIKKNNFTSRVNNDSNINYYLNKIKLLENKIEKKKMTIKNLEENVNLLDKDNQNLKRYINELESKIEMFQISNKTNIIKQDDILNIEQEMLNKIKLLSKEIQDKNEKIEKMENSDKLKIKDIMVLNQKCHDLELIIKENNKKQTSTLDKLINENNNFKSYINNTDKMMFTINYFIKRIYNMIPSLNNIEFNQSINDSNELQKHLICIENFISEYIIYNSNKKSQFFYDFEKNNNKNKIPINRNEEKEKEELEKKINEINEQNIFLLKEIQSQGKKKVKRKINSAFKNKKQNSKTKLK